MLYNRRISTLLRYESIMLKFNMENRNKALLLSIGFLMFVLGMLSLVLSLVGVRLVIFSMIDDLGFLWAGIIKLILVVGGILMAFKAQSNQEIL